MVHELETPSVKRELTATAPSTSHPQKLMGCFARFGKGDFARRAIVFQVADGPGSGQVPLVPTGFF
jgi:hypothetical protein